MSQSVFPPALEVELPGLHGTFVSLQELGSDLDWQEAVADAWGIPDPTKAAHPGLLNRLASLPQKLIALSSTAIRAVSSNGVA